MLLMMPMRMKFKLVVAFIVVFYSVGAPLTKRGVQAQQPGATSSSSSSSSSGDPPPRDHVDVDHVELEQMNSLMTAARMTTTGTTTASVENEHVGSTTTAVGKTKDNNDDDDDDDDGSVDNNDDSDSRGAPDDEDVAKYLMRSTRYDYTVTPAPARVFSSSSSSSDDDDDDNFITLLDTRHFRDTLRGKTSIVLFRSVATKRIREVRGKIRRALELLPPGLVDVFGEVDVKYDSLLRIRYAPGIQYAGTKSSRGSGGGNRIANPADDVVSLRGYKFGGKRMLLRQMQIVVFNGVKPVAHFAEAATALNIAAFVSATLARGMAVPMSGAMARVWMQSATTVYPVVLACVAENAKKDTAATTSSGDNDDQNESSVEVAMAVAAAKSEMHRAAAMEAAAASTTGSAAGIPRLGYMDDARECEIALGEEEEGVRFRAGDVHLFTNPVHAFSKKKTTPWSDVTLPHEDIVRAAEAAEAAAAAMLGAKADTREASSLPSSSVGDLLAAHSELLRTLSWENEFHLFLAEHAPVNYKPLVVMVLPSESAAAEAAVEVAAAVNKRRANEMAMREAVRSLPSSDRRLFVSLYADVNKYRRQGARPPRLRIFTHTHSHNHNRNHHMKV